MKSLLLCALHLGAVCPAAVVCFNLCSDFLGLCHPASALRSLVEAL